MSAVVCNVKVLVSRFRFNHAVLVKAKTQLGLHTFGRKMKAGPMLWLEKGEKFYLDPGKFEEFRDIGLVEEVEDVGLISQYLEDEDIDL